MTERQDELLRALHDEHAAALWAFVLRLTGDRARAEDVVQDTLMRAWRRPAVLDQSERSARAWLFTVARNIVTDQWRSAYSRHELATDNPPEPDAQDDRTDALLDSWLVADALAQLSVEHRAVLVECYFRGRSTAEAARALVIPEGTVKSRTHYALRAMRLQLEEMGVSS